MTPLTFSLQESYSMLLSNLLYKISASKVEIANRGVFPGKEGVKRFFLHVQ
jgi:hypothetical protein